jgi:flagellar hook protein FlgE
MISDKPLKWKVTAMDASGNEIANSSTEQFKVK